MRDDRAWQARVVCDPPVTEALGGRTTSPRRAMHQRPPRRHDRHRSGRCYDRMASEAPAHVPDHGRGGGQSRLTGDAKPIAEVNSQTGLVECVSSPF